MSEHMLLYISRSLIPPARADAELRDLVERPRIRKRASDVTGALIHSELRRFAQILEGEAAAVHAIMASIRRDPRHTRITMLYDGPLQRRMFGSWSLAYTGQSAAIDIAIEAAETSLSSISPGPRNELVALIAHFARAS